MATTPKTRYLETWTVDGYNLTQGTDVQWEMRSGTGTVAGLVGSNTTVPYRSGEIWTRKNIGPGSFVLNLWFAGADAKAADAVYNEILRSAVRPERLVTWKRAPNDGSPSRFCRGEIISTLETTAITQSGTAYRVAVEVHVPDGRWRTNDTFTLASDAGADLPKTVSFTGSPLADSTCPMEDLVYQVSGPLDAGWQLLDVNSNDSLTVNEPVAAGATVTIDAGAWNITSSTTQPNLAAYEVNGPRLMTVTHGNSNFDPGVQLIGTGGGAKTKLVVSGQASYLV